MQCVKTGAVIHLACHGEWLYGDAFLSTKSELIVRVRLRSHEPITDVKHFTITSYDVWFDETATSGDRNSTLIAAGFVNHGYEGVPHE